MMTSEETRFRKNSLWVLFLVVSMFFYMLFVWNIDISTSSIMNEHEINYMLGEYAVVGTLTNGFYGANPVQIYHVGLIGSILLFVFMSIWLYMTRVSNDFLRRRIEALENEKHV